MLQGHHRTHRNGPRVINHQFILHRAIKWGQAHTEFLVDLVQTLLDCGADANCKDYFRRTPLMYALKYVPDYKLKRVIDIFVRYKGLSQCKDTEGLSASDHPRWKSL